MHRVAVSMRVVEPTAYVDPRDALSHDWSRFFQRFDIVPVLVPNTLANPQAFLHANQVQYVLLTNGNNVGLLADEPPDLEIPDISIARDRTERALLDYALSQSLPVLGVCRGMQFINTYFNGRLTRDVSSLSKQPGNHVATMHDIEVTGIRDLDLPPHQSVNSFHHQGVAGTDMGDDLTTFARAPDGLTEGLIHAELPVIGVQWHMERKNGPAAELLDRVLVEFWLSLS